MSIRIKIALASTIAAIVLLGGAGLIFLTTLRSGLQNSLDNSLSSQVDALSAQVTSTGAMRAAGQARPQVTDSTYGQILSATGTVLQSTSTQLEGPLLTNVQLAGVRSGVEKYFDIDADDHVRNTDHYQLRVLATPIGTAGVVAVVAVSRDEANEAVERAGKQLLVLGVVVLVITAGGSWFLARASLRPVERMRRQASELTVSDADEGLSVPRSKDELRRLALTFNELLAQLHSALARERSFVADAGHELRSPLTVLKGELELARRPGRTVEELTETLAIADDETERLIRLAEDLLTLARDEHADADMRQLFDVRGTVTAACERVEATARAAGVTIVVTAPVRTVVLGDEDRMRRAVDNLLANALRFSPESGTISVEVSTGDGMNSLAVRDEGPGFSPEFLPVAFDRFSRDSAARTRQIGIAGGSGLGLAIVRQIARGIGGEVRATNRSDRSGACVTIRWPAV